MKSFRSYLYFLSFLEGGSVMACELVAAKMLAPYFGTSLYIWAATLGLTLGGLTSGYFLGGILSKKYAQDIRLLYWVLIGAGVFLVGMPFTSKLIMESTIDMNLQTGAMTSLMVFMVPPLILMGMVSPIIINLLTQNVESAGNSAGNVYAISTLGGILFTFLIGFYIIPNFGLSRPIIITGVMLAIAPIIALLRKKSPSAALVLVVMMVSGGWQMAHRVTYPENYKVLYQSDGILGQIKVVDHPTYGYNNTSEKTGRGLIVNNTLQTFAGLKDNLQYSVWDWAHYFPTAASIFPENSRVLLLGLGGGTIVKQMGQLNYQVDAVEIDQRVWEICKTYFNVDPATNVVIDDARHYIKTTSQQYDIIIFDTFLSESVPEHLLTIEGIRDAKKILKPNGMIMANFYGFVDGEAGLAARSVYKTLSHAGLITEILATPGKDENRNLIFLASSIEQDFDKINYEEPNFERIDDLYKYFLTTSIIDTIQAEVLTDEQPKLSKMYAKAAMSWKKSYNQYYRKHFGEIPAW